MDFSSGEATETASGLKPVQTLSPAEAQRLGAKEFTVLQGILKRLDLQGEAARRGTDLRQLTIFAPTNSAFAKAYPGNSLAALSDEALKTIMFRHIVRGTVTTADTQSGIVSFSLEYLHFSIN